MSMSEQSKEIRQEYITYLKTVINNDSIHISEIVYPKTKAEYELFMMTIKDHCKKTTNKYLLLVKEVADLHNQYKETKDTNIKIKHDEMFNEMIILKIKKDYHDSYIFEITEDLDYLH